MTPSVERFRWGPADGRAGRETFYDLMDREPMIPSMIWAHCILLVGQQADHRREPPYCSVDMKEAVEAGEEGAAHARSRLSARSVATSCARKSMSGSNRVLLKDEFGGRHVRVRGYDKVLAHLMFGMTVLTAMPADAPSNVPPI